MRSAKVLILIRSMGCLVLLMSSQGCLRREPQALNPCVVSGVAQRIKVTSVEKVDFLLMIDNSTSMEQEQANLRVQIPRLVKVLTTGDLGENGTVDFPAVKDLNVGVIDSDMGTGGNMILDVPPRCDDSPVNGDNGKLRTLGNPAGDASLTCSTSYPAIQNFRPGVTSISADQFARNVGCVAALGVGGCGYEQQLEAVLKGLTPSSSPIVFYSGRGIGDTDNDGFLRNDSLLAILLLTDEDDCSARDVDLYNPAVSSKFPDTEQNKPNVRCASTFHNESLQPLSRYVDGLLALRDPDLLVYGAITGVPPELVSDTANIDYTEILNDPLMQEEVAVCPTMTGGLACLRPSCMRANTGLAYPPRRIVETAKLLQERGSNGVIQSICQDSYEKALDEIIKKIADALGNICLPRPLYPDAQGRVNCDVVEVLPTKSDFTHCSQVPGRDSQPVRFENGQEVCRVQQVVPDRSSGTPRIPDGALGWYYDDFTNDVRERCGSKPRRVSFTDGAKPITGSTVRLECLNTAIANTSAEAQLASPCIPDDATEGDAFCADSKTTLGMICDPFTRTCQKACTTDADCTVLGGFLCDVRREGTAYPLVCVNPTCTQAAQ